MPRPPFPTAKKTQRSSPSDFGGSSQVRFPHERLERFDSERRQLARFGTSVMPRVCNVDAVVRMINKCNRVRGRYPDISIHVDACELSAILPGACFSAFSLRKTRPRVRSRERLTFNHVARLRIISSIEMPSIGGTPLMCTMESIRRVGKMIRSPCLAIHTFGRKRL